MFLVNGDVGSAALNPEHPEFPTTRLTGARTFNLRQFRLEERMRVHRTLYAASEGHECGKCTEPRVLEESIARYSMPLA